MPRIYHRAAHRVRVRAGGEWLASLTVGKGLLVLPALAVVGVLSGCGSATIHVGASHAAGSPLTVRIQLDDTHVPAGTAIDGEAVLTNNTAKSIALDSCPRIWFQVGLSNSTVRYDPANSEPACSVLHGGHVTPGPHRVPIVVETTYTSCGGTPPPQPLCTPFGIPALPAGRYETKVYLSGLPKGTPSPLPVWVTVTPPEPSVPASVPHGTIDAKVTACGGPAPPRVQVALWRGENLLGIKTGAPGTFVFRVPPGRYVVQDSFDSAPRQAIAKVTLGATAHVELATVC